MSNGERKSHVKRFYKDDDPQSDTWIDIERLDELSYFSGRGYQYRLKKWKFAWDKFDDDAATKKTITDPNDPTGETFIEVPVRDKIFMRDGDQGNKHYFINDGSNQTRVTHSRRVYHHDIDTNEFGEPPRDPEQYLRALGEQDKAQYVDVELLDRYWSQENEGRDAQGKIKRNAWQEKRWIPTENDPLLQDPMRPTDESDSDFRSVQNPEDGPTVDPPWRLDPLQNIVNISWGAGLAVQFFPEES